MKLLISDTCILIDLFNGDLLSSMCRLPYELGVSDAVLSGFEKQGTELREPNPKQVLGSGFLSYSLSSEEIYEVYELYSRYPQPSLCDIFGLVTAKIHKAILLTGDNSLRKSANKENIEVRGILWVLDELVEHKVIAKGNAAISLRKIIAKGSYLPKTECIRRFNKWK